MSHMTCGTVGSDDVLIAGASYGLVTHERQPIGGTAK